MSVGNFYDKNRDAVIALLQEMMAGLPVNYRIAENDAFEYLILRLHPPPILEFFGLYEFITIRMEDAHFRLGYSDENFKRRVEYFADVGLLRHRLLALKPLLAEIIHQWEENVIELRKEADEN